MKIFSRRHSFAAALVAFFLSFVSCSAGAGEQPDNVIEKNKFVEILADAQIFESTHQFIKGKNPDFRLDYNYEWIFNKYEVTKEQFNASVEHYSSNPQTYEEIYDEVIIKISEKEADLTKQGPVGVSGNDQKLP